MVVVLEEAPSWWQHLQKEGHRKKISVAVSNPHFYLRNQKRLSYLFSHVNVS